MNLGKNIFFFLLGGLGYVFFVVSSWLYGLIWMGFQDIPKTCCFCFMDLVEMDFAGRRPVF